MSYLVITRAIDQRVYLRTRDGEVVVLVMGVEPDGRVKLGISAPETVAIVRDNAKQKAPAVTGAK